MLVLRVQQPIILLLLQVPVGLDITDVFAGVRRALSLPHTEAGLGQGARGCRGRPLQPLLLGEDVEDGAVGAAAIRVLPALEILQLVR